MHTRFFKISDIILRYYFFILVCNKKSEILHFTLNSIDCFYIGNSREATLYCQIVTILRADIAASKRLTHMRSHMWELGLMDFWVTRRTMHKRGSITGWMLDRSQIARGALHNFPGPPLYLVHEIVEKFPAQ